MSRNKNLYVERRPQGDYAVRRGGSDRASDVLQHNKRPLSGQENSILATRQTSSEFDTQTEESRTSGVRLKLQVQLA